MRDSLRRPASAEIDVGSAKKGRRQYASPFVRTFGPRLVRLCEALRGRSPREVIRDHPPPAIRRVDRGRNHAPEERLRNGRTAREEQMIDVVTIEVGTADRILPARSGSGRPDAMERIDRLRPDGESTLVGLDHLDD